MENKTADIFKAIAFIIFIFGGMASLILFSMENMRLISLYTLLAAFFQVCSITPLAKFFSSFLISNIILRQKQRYTIIPKLKAMTFPNYNIGG